MAEGERALTIEQIVAWRGFLGAHARVVERLERELVAERDLPIAWFDVLQKLREADGTRLRMFDLARAVLISRAGLTRLVDRMADAGLVERLPAPEDRRGRYVALTPAGCTALKGATPVHQRGIAEHFSGLLSEGETAALATMMTRILEHAEAR